MLNLVILKSVNILTKQWHIVYVHLHWNMVLVHDSVLRNTTEHH